MCSEPVLPEAVGKTAGDTETSTEAQHLMQGGSLMLWRRQRQASRRSGGLQEELRDLILHLLQLAAGDRELVGSLRDALP